MSRPTRADLIAGLAGVRWPTGEPMIQLADTHLGTIADALLAADHLWAEQPSGDRTFDSESRVHAAEYREGKRSCGGDVVSAGTCPRCGGDGTIVGRHVKVGAYTVICPLLDPDYAVWVCPDDARMLRLELTFPTLTFVCPGCGGRWDFLTHEPVVTAL